MYVFSEVHFYIILAGFLAVMPFVRYHIVRPYGISRHDETYDSKYIAEIVSVITAPFSPPYAHDWNNKTVLAMMNLNKKLFTLFPVLVLPSIFIGEIWCRMHEYGA